MEQFLDYLQAHLDSVPQYYWAKNGLEPVRDKIKHLISVENYLDADELLQPVLNELDVRGAA